MCSPLAFSLPIFLSDRSFPPPPTSSPDSLLFFLPSFRFLLSPFFFFLHSLLSSSPFYPFFGSPFLFFCFFFFSLLFLPFSSFLSPSFLTSFLWIFSPLYQEFSPLSFFFFFVLSPFSLPLFGSLILHSSLFFLPSLLQTPHLLFLFLQKKTSTSHVLSTHVLMLKTWECGCGGDPMSPTFFFLIFFNYKII